MSDHIAITNALRNLGYIKRHRTLCYEAAETIERQGRELDALREDNARLREAAELGLEYAKAELDRLKSEFDGYPSKWELDEIYVRLIEYALNPNSSTEESK
jgi:hypothetical protein